MKKLLFTLLCTSFMIAGNAQNNRIGHYFCYRENPGELIQKSHISKELFYSFSPTRRKMKDSVLLGAVYYNSSGSPVRRTVFQDGKEITEYAYQYNSLNKLFRSYSYQKGARLDTMIIEHIYDNAGNDLQDCEYYDDNGDSLFMGINQKSYNEKRQLICVYSKLNGGLSYISEKLFYNEHDSLVKKEYYYPSGTLAFSNAYVYDRNLNKTTIYDDDPKRGRKLYLEEIFDKDNHCVNSHSFETKPTLHVDNENRRRAPTTFKDIPRADEYTYNPDGTVFEWTVHLDKKKSQIIRHYYQKN
jgi:hypothetical protein